MAVGHAASAYRQLKGDHAFSPMPEAMARGLIRHQAHECGHHASDQTCGCQGRREAGTLPSRPGMPVKLRMAGLTKIM